MRARLGQRFEPSARLGQFAEDEPFLFFEEGIGSEEPLFASVVPIGSGPAIDPETGLTIDELLAMMSQETTESIGTGPAIDPETGLTVDDLLAGLARAEVIGGTGPAIDPETGLTITDLLSTLEKIAPSVAAVIIATQGKNSLQATAASIKTGTGGLLGGISPTVLLVIGGVILFMVMKK